MSKLNIGVIGTGPISRGHIKRLREDARVQLSALCDIDAKTLEAKGKENGIDALYLDHRSMLKKAELDAVFICTPTFAHYRPAMDALAAGKHVFCEKPLGLNAAESARMAAAARGARRILTVGMVMRCAPYFQMIKDYVDQGFFGHIRHLRFARRARRSIPNRPWFTDPARGGGVLRDLGIHSLDLLMWATGQWKPRRVSAGLHSFFGQRGDTYVDMRSGGASTTLPKYAGDDFTTGMVRFEGDATLAFEVAWAADAPEMNEYEILGEKGGMRVDLRDKENMFRFFTEQNGYLVDIHPRLDIKHSPAMAPVIRFVDAVLNGKPSPIPAEEAVVIMSVVDAVYASGRRGAEVPLRAAPADTRRKRR